MINNRLAEEPPVGLAARPSDRAVSEPATEKQAKPRITFGSQVQPRRDVDEDWAASRLSCWFIFPVSLPIPLPSATTVRLGELACQAPPVSFSL